MKVLSLVEIYAPEEGLLGEKAKEEIEKALEKGEARKVLESIWKWIEERRIPENFVDEIAVYAEPSWGSRKVWLRFEPFFDIEYWEKGEEFKKSVRRGEVKNKALAELSEPLVLLPVPDWVSGVHEDGYSFEVCEASSEWLTLSEAKKKVEEFKKVLEEYEERISKLERAEVLKIF